MKVETTAGMAAAAAAGLMEFPVLNQHPLDTAPGNTCCSDLVNQGLLVLYPDSQLYEQRTRSYWSVSAQLSPGCIVQPRNTEEVSVALTTILKESTCDIAVRAGGHTTWAGSNNIADGVTIDLGNMNATTYHAENSTASIQPGSRWLQVYETLDKFGVTVPGGRAGTVGVAGLILGGGNSFFSASKGMVCDNVVGYEMVTASGDVIYVTKESYSDLFVALKGGSSNFGIVTRFDVIAFEAPKVWGGVVVYPQTAGDALLDAMVAFADNVENDSASSSIGFWTYQPALKDTIIIAAYENTEAVEAGPSFEKYLAIPDRLSSTMRLTNMSDLAHELEQPTDYIDIWFTLTFKNDPQVLQYAVTTHNQLVEEFRTQSPDGDFITQCMFQPLPTLFAKHAADRGGNVLGLDGIGGNAVLWLATLAVRTPEQEAVGRETMVAWVKSVEDFAKSVGSNVEWRYLNYADYTQDPLSSYGKENLELIRAAANKYDPAGVFQTRVPGGFKISKAADHTG